MPPHMVFIPGQCEIILQSGSCTFIAPGASCYGSTSSSASLTIRLFACLLHPLSCQKGFDTQLKMCLSGLDPRLLGAHNGLGSRIQYKCQRCQSLGKSRPRTHSQEQWPQDSSAAYSGCGRVPVKTHNCILRYAAHDVDTAPTAPTHRLCSCWQCRCIAEPVAVGSTHIKSFVACVVSASWVVEDALPFVAIPL